MRETKFGVIVSVAPSGAYHVHVNLQGGHQFATTRASDLDTALRMAVPYMAAAAEPDPLAALLRGSEGAT